MRYVGSEQKDVDGVEKDFCFALVPQDKSSAALLNSQPSRVFQILTDTLRLALLREHRTQIKMQRLSNATTAP